jgi:two-component system response regulator YesN
LLIEAGDGMRLLIVDDEYIIRKGLVTLDWASVGIDDVLTVEDGLSARQILMNQNIDLVITDIKMPGLSGLEIADYVKRNNHCTKVIILSGFNEFEYAKSAIEANVSYYLLKPINPDELLKSARIAIEELKREKYKESLINQYETVKGSMSTTEQIISGFRNCNKIVIDILKYIAENYNHQICLNSLAEIYHFSAIYLSHLIKKETGYSFMEILLSIRLMNAAKLIRESNIKIVTVCEQVGFNDQRYFSQAFKKVFDLTPLEYKKLENETKEYSITQMIEVMNSKKLRAGEME